MLTLRWPAQHNQYVMEFAFARLRRCLKAMESGEIDMTYTIQYTNTTDTNTIIAAHMYM